MLMFGVDTDKGKDPGLFPQFLKHCETVFQHVHLILNLSTFAESGF